MEQFTLRPRNIAVVLKELDAMYGCMEPASAATMSGVYTFPNKGRIEIFKTGTVTFKGRSEDYWKLRILDMKEDREAVEAGNPGSPAICCLNFEHSIVGSDETGKGEVFKPIIVTAAYVQNEEEMYKYLKLGVTDSKQIKGKINTICKDLTGIQNWEEIKDRELIITDLFVSKIVSNEEYNRRSRERNGDSEGVLEELLEEAHIQVLKELYKKHSESMIVVDDYTNGRKVEAFRKKLAQGEDGIPGEKVFMTTQGDGKVMAVGLASIISYYICTLGFEYAKEQLNQIYKRPEIPMLELSATSEKTEAVEEFLAKLRPELKDEFMDKYAKCYFGNVRAAMKL